MAITATRLAVGPGWSVSDFVCDAGPHDRPFEERHEAVCISAVTAGTFQYRASHGAAVLAPGALMLGNEGACYECGHEHAAGDRCLAFHFAPALFERVVAAVPGAKRLAFATPRLPPLPALMPLLAEAEAARDARDAAALEELALRVAGEVAAALAGTEKDVPSLSARDLRRVNEALRRIEDAADEPLALADLADTAATSPFHFLRIFRSVVGMTPHQYLLRTRLHRAAVRLRRTQEPVAAIAYDAGFGDLSTFNRRFRRVMGTSPGEYRARG